MQHEQHGAAAAVWAALAAIGETDADAGEWLAEEGGTKRSFGSLDEWRAFVQRLLSGRARASVALDFPFADAGPGGLNLRVYCPGTLLMLAPCQHQQCPWAQAHGLIAASMY